MCSPMGKLMSWNVRGLNCLVKRLAILRTIKSLDAGIICLQETHPFTPSLTPWLFGTQFYSTYSRGISILLRQDVRFSCSHKIIDPGGRYVFILYNCWDIYTATVFIWGPQLLGELYGRFPNIPLLEIGDFNNFLNPIWDKLLAPVHTSSVREGHIPFACLLEELGQMDIWRFRNWH